MIKSSLNHFICRLFVIILKMPNATCFVYAHLLPSLLSRLVTNPFLNTTQIGQESASVAHIAIKQKKLQL